MTWWMHRPLGAALLAIAMCAPTGACSGRSSSNSGSDGGSGDTGGTGGSPGSGGGDTGGKGGSTSGTSGTSGAGGTGGTAGGCSYNGVHYDVGQTFGACDQCTCDSASGVYCKEIACPATGGTTGSVGGTGGTSTGCDVGDQHYDEGDSWPADCNTCYCKGSEVSCTMVLCTPTGGAGGAGGAAGKGGAGGTGAIGAGGEAGSTAECTYAEVGSFCIVGKPTNEGQELVVGMPLTVSMRPSGCFSSSCTKLVSADCNYLGSNFVYSVSGFICLATENEGVCTSDCGGGGNPVCEPGVTLEAGQYTVDIGGSTIPALKFTVPSEFHEGELCSPPIEG